MDLSKPIASVFPGAHGAVLAVLARTYEPVSGRRVAGLTNGRVGSSRASQVLSDLTGAGIVICADRPPAKLYQLNRDHVAAESIVALTSMWTSLVERIRDELAIWEVSPWSAALFGSAARGEAGPTSDIDILIVVDDADPRQLSEIDGAWLEQTSGLAECVRLWSGNECEILELTVTELRAAVARDDRIIRDLRSDAIHLIGEPLQELLGKKRVLR